MTRVEAPARLHFGLLSVPIAGERAPDRLFGGVGLMIDSPRVVVEIESASDWSATGPSDRESFYANLCALKVWPSIDQLLTKLPIAEKRTYAIRVLECPEEHAGFGSGTALALSVAKAYACEIGHADWSAVELAKRVGRGERSAVGVHGFEQGGLIVEAGKTPGEAISPLFGRYEFPADWRIVLVYAEVYERWHGLREQGAFANLTRQNPTLLLHRIVDTRLIPALKRRDINEFGEALHEYNLRASEAFVDAQGGNYASPAIAELVDWIRKEGIRGVGQSSWGPTVFAVVANEADATQLVQRLASRGMQGTITAANGTGAKTI